MLAKLSLTLPQAANWQDPGTGLPTRQSHTFRLLRVCDEALFVARAIRHVNPMEKKQYQLQSGEGTLSTKTRSMLYKSPGQAIVVIYHGLSLVKVDKKFHICFDHLHGQPLAELQQ